MGYGITFAPLVPLYLLWGAIAVAVFFALLLVFVRSRGWAVRALALAHFAGRQRQHRLAVRPQRPGAGKIV